MRTANPLTTMFRLARLSAVVLICGSLSVPAIGPISEAMAWRSVILSVIGAVVGVTIEMFVCRRIDLFGKRE
jgi:hypothetical protein